MVHDLVPPPADAYPLPTLRVGLGRADSNYKAAMRSDPCAYCGWSTTGVLDHIVPVSRGGHAVWTNLTATCTGCNTEKHALSLLAFLGVREQRRRVPRDRDEVVQEIIADGGPEALLDLWDDLRVRLWRGVGT